MNRKRLIAMEEFIRGNETVPLYDWHYYMDRMMRLLGPYAGR